MPLFTRGLKTCHSRAFTVHSPIRRSIDQSRVAHLGCWHRGLSHHLRHVAAHDPFWFCIGRSRSTPGQPTTSVMGLFKPVFSRAHLGSCYVDARQLLSATVCDLAADPLRAI